MGVLAEENRRKGPAEERRKLTEKRGGSETLNSMITAFLARKRKTPDAASRWHEATTECRRKPKREAAEENCGTRQYGQREGTKKVFRK